MTVHMNSMHVVATGVSITTAAASAGAAIPNNSAGQRPAYIRLAATAACAVRLGVGAQTALATDLLIQPGDAQIVGVGPANNIAAIQISAPGVLIVTPLEDFA